VSEINLFAKPLCLSVEEEAAEYSIPRVPRVFAEVESSEAQEEEIQSFLKGGVRPIRYFAGRGFKSAMVIINTPILTLAGYQEE